MCVYVKCLIVVIQILKAKIKLNRHKNGCTKCIHIFSIACIITQFFHYLSLIGTMTKSLLKRSTCLVQVLTRRCLRSASLKNINITIV